MTYIDQGDVQTICFLSAARSKATHCKLSFALHPACPKKVTAQQGNHRGKTKERCIRCRRRIAIISYTPWRLSRCLDLTATVSACPNHHHPLLLAERWLAWPEFDSVVGPESIAMRTFVQSSNNLEFISSTVNALESKSRKNRRKSVFLVDIFS